MASAKNGDTVRVQYTGKFEDGTIFDTSEGGASLEFKVGEGEILSGVEEGVVGMSPGETKTIYLEQAFGPRKEEMVFEFNRNRAPADFDPAIGERVQMHRADGEPVMVTVVDKTENSFIMDCNHPLAGKNLILDITLEEIL